MYRRVEELRAELPAGEIVIRLSQGDIIDDCPLVFWADLTREVSAGVEPESVEARVIILTQACDLANDKTVRAMVAVIHDAAGLVRTGRVKEKFIRDNVRKGQVYGWYFLPAHSSCPGFPESLVDLRDVHTVPRALLEGLRDKGKLVCRLTTPYREHLAQHFSVTYSRIGLPEPYETEESQ
jgi:hypothetical protein